MIKMLKWYLEPFYNESEIDMFPRLIVSLFVLFVAVFFLAISVLVWKLSEVGGSITYYFIVSVAMWYVTTLVIYKSLNSEKV